MNTVDLRYFGRGYKFEHNKKCVCNLPSVQTYITGQSNTNLRYCQGKGNLIIKEFWGKTKTMQVFFYVTFSLFIFRFYNWFSFVVIQKYYFFTHLYQLMLSIIIQQVRVWLDCLFFQFTSNCLPVNCALFLYGSSYWNSNILENCPIFTLNN